MADYPVESQDAAAKAAASAAWLAANRPDLVTQQPTTAAQAAALNAAWQNNQLPVKPQYAAGGGAQYTQAQIDDARREAEKYAYFNTPIDYAKYANVPLSQMPANIASRVQDHYASHPTAAAQAITRQYQEQQTRTVTSSGTYSQPTNQVAPSNPYDPDSAAGIAWDVGRTGAVEKNLGMSALQQGVDPSRVVFATTAFQSRPELQSTRVNVSAKEIIAGSTGPVSFESGRSTVATREPAATAPLSVTGSKMVAGVAGYQDITGTARGAAAITTFVPYGEQRQTAIENSKVLLDYKTGEIAIYQYDAAHDRWGLISGGGRAALQSGMFTVGKAATPWVVTQESGGSEISKYGNAQRAAMVAANPSAYSRLGAEAYGGYVKPLDARTLPANAPMARYANQTNLANWVQQKPATKQEAAGADIPWRLDRNAPAAQYMDEKGIMEGTTIFIPGVTTPDRIIGGKTIASEVVVAPTTPQEAATATVAPQTLGGMAGATLAAYNPFTSGANRAAVLNRGGSPVAPYAEAFAAGVGNVMRDPLGALAGAGALVVAKNIEAAKMQGAMGVATIDTAAGAIIPDYGSVAPALGLTQREPGKVTTSTQEIVTSGGGSKAADQMKTWIDNNRPILDQTNPEAVARFNTVVKAYNIEAARSPEFTERKTITTTSEVGGKTYQYGEFSRYSEQMGGAVRSGIGVLTGGKAYTPEQLEAYGVTLESKPGVEGVAQRIVFQAGKYASTEPAMAIPTIAAGGLMVVGGEAIATLVTGAAAGSGAVAGGASVLSTPGAGGVAGSIARGIYNYGGITLMTGVAGYGLTNRGTDFSRETVQKNLETSVVPGALFGLGAGAVMGGRPAVRETAPTIDTTSVASGGLLRQNRAGIDMTEVASGGLFSSAEKGGVRSNLPEGKATARDYIDLASVRAREIVRRQPDYSGTTYGQEVPGARSAATAKTVGAKPWVLGDEGTVAMFGTTRAMPGETIRGVTEVIDRSRVRLQQPGDRPIEFDLSYTASDAYRSIFTQDTPRATAAAKVAEITASPKVRAEQSVVAPATAPEMIARARARPEDVLRTPVEARARASVAAEERARARYATFSEDLARPKIISTERTDAVAMARGRADVMSYSKMFTVAEAAAKSRDASRARAEVVPVMFSGTFRGASSRSAAVSTPISRSLISEIVEPRTTSRTTGTTGSASRIEPLAKPRVNAGVRDTAIAEPFAPEPIIPVPLIPRGGNAGSGGGSTGGAKGGGKYAFMDRYLVGIGVGDLVGFGLSRQPARRRKY